MQHHVIALVTPQRLATLHRSLLPWASKINLWAIVSGDIGPTSAEEFAALHILPADSETPAELLNAAVREAECASYVILLPEVEAVFPGFIEAVEAAIERHKNFAGLEFRTLPLEAEHHIDPVSLESPTLGGACLVDRAAFLRAGGLDPAFGSIHMWDELSLRLRAGSGTVYYAPQAVVSAAAANVPDSGRTAYLSDVNNSLQMACKYGSQRQRAQARKSYWQAVQNPCPFPHIRRLLVQQYTNGLALRRRLNKWRRANPELLQQMRQLPENGLSLRRGACPLASPITDGPRFSVIIRTHSRPALLRGALQSVANQTYQNCEVIVVEDGPPAACQMIENEFSHLNIIYHATREKVGRSRAGNIGMSMATGQYLNLLDDDDYFYPDHLEQMAAQIQNHPEADLVLGCSVSMFTDDDSAQAHVRTAARYTLMRFDRLDVFTMSQMCQIPLLSVAFKRELFQRYGGLHEGMDAHEDWAMWLKYLPKAARIHPYGIDIPRATSVFLQPASQQEAERRLSAYRAYDEALFHDPDIRFEVSLADMRRFYDGVLADIRHVKQLGQLDEFLERESHRDEL